jgi:hypothetical protein
MARLQFIDKSKAENYNNGIEYFAVGLIVSCHMENGVSNPSGKDYAVEYIDPSSGAGYSIHSAKRVGGAECATRP